MKINTIEQYKILQFIKGNFYMEELQLTLINRYTIEINDKNNYTIQFKYDNGEIVY